MKKNNQQLIINWQSYNEPHELPEQEQALLVAAAEALLKAYAPYSHFRVGAALLLEDGTIISGANYENAAYPMCLCAERSAIAAAVSTQPGQKIKKIAITVANEQKSIDQPAAPCGACRQVMVETELRQEWDMKVILRGQRGSIITVDSARALLPFHFDGSFL